MPAVDIGMEMPEVEIPRAPKEDKGPVPRRSYIRAKDIDRHGVTRIARGALQLCEVRKESLIQTRVESG